MRFRHAVLAVGVALAVSSVGRAQGIATIAGGPATSPQTAEETPVVALSIHPAPEPQPALRYRLLPPVSELQPGNAALLYDTAILIVSERSEAEELGKVRDWLDVPTAELPREEVQSALYALQHATRYLDLAARRESCDWQLPLKTEGPNALLPGLSKMRDMARLLALKARVEIADGKHHEALRTIQTGFALARHTAEAPTLIHGLVGMAISGLMLQQVEGLIQAPDAPNLYWALAALPGPLVDLRRAMEQETEWLFVLLPELREAQTSQLTDAEWQALLENLVGLPGQFDGSKKQAAGTAMALLMYPKGKRWMVEQGHTQEEVDAMPVARVVVTYMVQPYIRLRDEQQKWLYLPYRQAREGLRRAEEQINAARQSFAGNVLVMLMPALGRVSFQVAKHERSIAALRCVEAVRLYAAAHDARLPARLSDITEVPIPIDPVTGEQFTYELVDGKATLYSPPPPDGQPRDGLHYELTITK